MVDAWLVRGYKTAVEQANDAKLARIALPTRDDLYAKAWRRVQKSPRLRKYEDIILQDWPEGDDHLRWVIRGRVGEIVAWAEQIRRDSDG
jgi:hypothetical protein